MPARGAFQPLEQRVLSGFDRGANDECWLWRGQTRGGYGWIWLSGPRNARKRGILVHRFMWALHNGVPIPSPENVKILHRCDTPACCNPAHLFAGSTQDNVTDKIRKGRHPHTYSRETQIEVRSARDKGLSTRQIGAMLDIPKSSVWMLASCDRPGDATRRVR